MKPGRQQVVCAVQKVAGALAAEQVRIARGAAPLLGLLG